MTSLMDLNDDCVRHVCSYLGTKDQLNVVLVCDRVFDMIKQIDWSSFVIDYTPIQAEIIFSKIGDNLQNINYKQTYANSEINVLREFTSFGKLNELTLKYCPNAMLNVNFCSTELTDSDIRLISALSQLKTLNLHFRHRITGKYLDKLQNLLHLDLGSCWSFESEHFIKMCKVNKLKTLQIARCAKLNDAAIKALAETQTDLEEIRLGLHSASNLAIVCQIKSLKRLGIEGPQYSSVLSEAVRNLADTLEEFNLHHRECVILETRQQILKLRNLKVLDLYLVYHIMDDQFLHDIGLNCTRLEELRICNVNEMTDIGMIKFIENAQNLKSLYLIGWLKFDELLFKKIVTVVELKNCPKPLKINAAYAGIGEDFIDKEVYKNTMELVILSFDTWCYAFFFAKLLPYS